MTNMDKIAKVLTDYKDMDGVTLTAETTFAELELDSLDTVDMVMACEEEFGVTIEMDESIKTVGNLLDVIEKQL